MWRDVLIIILMILLIYYVCLNIKNNKIIKKLLKKLKKMKKAKKRKCKCECNDESSDSDGEINTKENFAYASPHYFIDNDNPYFREDPHIKKLDPPTRNFKGTKDPMNKSQNVGDSRYLYMPDDSILTLGKSYDFYKQVNEAIDDYREKMAVSALINKQ